jgi:DNA replication protein DnaC
MGTVISTNLDPVHLRDQYSERIYSRIVSSFTLIRLDGEDIRIKKKFKV